MSVYMYIGTAKEYYLAVPGASGIMYKIVPETTNSSYTNVMTCFAIPGDQEAPVAVQQVLPDLSQYTVSHNQTTCTTTLHRIYIYMYTAGTINTCMCVYTMYMYTCMYVLLHLITEYPKANLNL